MNNKTNINTIFSATVADLFELTADLPCRIIQRDGQPYLERYYLGGSSEHKIVREGGAAYLHRFVGGGEDEALHDHPWKCESYILHGHYTERRLIDTATTSERLLKADNSNIINPYQPHQILNPAPETWTLFTTDRKTRSWHFYVQITGENAYMMINYKDYLNKHDRESAGQRKRHDWWNADDCPTGNTAGRQPLAKYFRESQQ